jgi:hypothetical protein
MATSDHGSSSGATAGKESEIDDLLKHLDLRDDELEEVVVRADKAKEYQMVARWLAVAKVHTTRSFSSEALFGKMKAVWNLSRDPICREAGENLFVFQMHCLGDWKKVVHQGPWTFCGWAVLIEDYDGKEDPEKISLGACLSGHKFMESRSFTGNLMWLMIWLGVWVRLGRCRCFRSCFTRGIMSVSA